MITTIIETIPNEVQRYPTVGDYSTSDFGTTHIRVSWMADRDYEFLVGLHELIEAYLVKKREIDEEAITEFDIQFEEKRIPGNYDEPGDDPNAPYYLEHQFATKIEKAVAEELGVDWDAYDKAVNSL